MPKVVCKNSHLCLIVNTGVDFHAAAKRHPEWPLKFGCRRGECGVCAIKIVKGMQNLTKRTPEEDQTLARKNLSAEYRLACQCALNGCGDIEAEC